MPDLCGAALNIYAAVFSTAINCKSICLQNEWRMSWQDEQENKWILFCLRLLASIPLPGLRVWLGGNGLSHRGGTIQNQSMQYHTKPHKTIQTIANQTNNIPYQYHSKPYRTTTEVETAWLRLHTTDAFLPPRLPGSKAHKDFLPRTSHTFKHFDPERFKRRRAYYQTGS